MLWVAARRVVANVVPCYFTGLKGPTELVFKCNDMNVSVPTFNPDTSVAFLVTISGVFQAPRVGRLAPRQYLV
jgi:hypothetical protein